MLFRRSKDAEAKVVRHKPRCSFCDKEQGRGIRLIAGSGVYICSECIEVANQMLRGDRPAPAQG